MITFGKLHTGTAFNIIADKAELEGTLRSFTPEVREVLQKKLADVVDVVAKISGTTIQMNLQQGYPPVLNGEREVDIALDAARLVFGEEYAGFMKPNMVGEDFSYYPQEVPGSFCFVGAGAPDKSAYPHHHPRFQIDESVLPLAVEWFCYLAMKYLNGGEAKNG